MNLRPAGNWLLLVSCTLTWPGCAQPIFKQQAASVSPIAPRHVGRPDKDKYEGQVSMARLAERSGQTEQAQRMYQALIDKQPDNHVPYHRLGVLAAHDKKWRLAEQYLNQAYALEPSSIELLSDMGYFYYLQNRNQEAENILRQALALDAGDKAANNNLGLVLGEQQRFDESLAVFRRAGSEADARANLAFVLAQGGRYDQALDAYSKALSLDPKLRPAAMAMLQLAQKRPGPPANEPANAPQVASNERNGPQTANDEAVLADEQVVVVSDGPLAFSPEMPKPAATAASTASNNSSRRSKQIHDREVVLASHQQEQVAPDRPREAAPQTGVPVRTSRVVKSGQGPTRTSPKFVRPVPQQEVPGMAIKAEPRRSLGNSRGPELVANEFVREPSPQLPVPTAATTSPSPTQKRNAAQGPELAAPRSNQQEPPQAVPEISSKPEPTPSLGSGRRPELVTNEFVPEPKPQPVAQAAAATPSLSARSAKTTQAPSSAAPEISRHVAPQSVPRVAVKPEPARRLSKSRSLEFANNEFVKKQWPQATVGNTTASPAAPARNSLKDHGLGSATDKAVRNEPTQAVPGSPYKAQPKHRLNKGRQLELAATERVPKKGRPQPVVRTAATTQVSPVQNPHAVRGRSVANEVAVRKKPPQTVPKIALVTEPKSGSNESRPNDRAATAPVKRNERPQRAVLKASPVPPSRSFKSSQPSPMAVPTLKRL